jgi:hypothetical protein
MVKFIINYLWHDVDACSQIAKSVLKVLSSDGTCDGGASWFLLLFQERVEYSCATLTCKLYDLGGRQDPLVAKDILEILGIRGGLHSIKKWYVAVKLLEYLDELAELLVGHRRPFPL